MWATKPGKPHSTATRFAELYAQTLDRLADPRSPLRVGALHTLGALSQDYPAGRPAIVDVLCAYLRMNGDDDRSVRAIAQLILAEHLRPGGSGFWPGVGLDLRGACLIDLDLSGCRIDADLILDGAVFVGPARLRGLSVRGTASLRQAEFSDHAWFERSTFRGPVRLDNATFTGDAWFGGSSFHAPADFSEAVFRRSVGFRGAQVGAISLHGTTFLGPARVSRRGDDWNVAAPGWVVVVDQDNEAVGGLLWVGDNRWGPGYERAPEEQVTPV